MNVSDAKRLKELEAENARLKRPAGRIDVRERGHQRGLEKKVVSAPARRDLVRYMIDKGFSERRALRIVSMSSSAYRYEPTPDRNCALRQKIIALTQRHRRYGAGMIYLKLRQVGYLNTLHAKISRGIVLLIS